MAVKAGKMIFRNGLLGQYEQFHPQFSDIRNQRNVDERVLSHRSTGGPGRPDKFIDTEQP
jgi:hypothetical protein